MARDSFAITNLSEIFGFGRSLFCNYFIDRPTRSLPEETEVL